MNLLLELIMVTGGVNINVSEDVTKGSKVPLNASMLFLSPASQRGVRHQTIHSCFLFK